MAFLEILKVIFIGIIEGITEWLPISSTGHMLLVDQFIKLDASQEFKDMFFVVIQFGAIMAVVYLYWKKLWPIHKTPNLRKLSKRRRENELVMGKYSARKNVIVMWIMVIVATIPAAIIGLLLDDWMDEYAHTPFVIAVALIVYGVLFILVENQIDGKEPEITKLSQIDFKTALKLGGFQALAIIPGTSRSGATIIGGLTIGVSRKLAAEFSFFMGIPVMLGWSIVKMIKFGFSFTAFEVFELLVGMIVAFVVSMFVIRYLIEYIKGNNFKIFGYYRIALGVLMIIVFSIKAIAGA